MKQFLLLSLLLSAPQILAEVRIAVIDSGYSIDQAKYLCKDRSKNYIIPTSEIDDIGHGSNIISIIAQLNQKFCILPYKIFGKHTRASSSSIALAITLATADKADYINLSFSGDDFDSLEKWTIEQALKKGIKVFVAAGNDGRDLSKNCNVYPACYDMSKNFKVVGAPDFKGSNFGGTVNTMAPGKNQGYMQMTGTSFATPNAILYDLEKKYYKSEVRCVIIDLRK